MANGTNLSRKEIDLYNDLRGQKGYTPFQFSSRKTQFMVTQLGGFLPDNPASDYLNDVVGWYDMWINPQKIDLSTTIMNKNQHTLGSVVTYHYRRDLVKMKISGQVGWIAIGPFEEGEGVGKYIKNRTTGDPSKTEKSMPSGNNSPRIFLKKIRDMAFEPPYFVDLAGVDHYNTKYIKIYTKQYPTGIICEGYYNSFNIPESGDDGQTIDYNFDFTIETMKPITLLQRMAGMYADKGGRDKGETIRKIPGLS